MQTPLVHAVQQFLDEKRAPFHMPGHKGTAVYPVGDAARYDITEVDGADSLFEASGAIAQTEAHYAMLYGTAASLLCTGGSTLCIQTMFALAAKPGSHILCGRGVHTAAVNAMTLLGQIPVWLWPEVDNTTGLAKPITAQQVEDALAIHPDIAAVYLTCPNYFGVMADIGAVSAVCRKYHVPLLVDNAHGAHLRFTAPDLHPISLGATMCSDSLHKMLPVLTGGAMLHIADPVLVADAKRRMSLFGSTSPSYLIMQSIDAALPWLETGAHADLAEAEGQIAALERQAAELGLLIPADKHDPLRLSIGYRPTGLDYEAMKLRLHDAHIEPEYLSDSFCVLLASAHNTPAHFALAADFLRSLPPCHPCSAGPAPIQPPQVAMPPRDAVFAPSVTIPVEKAIGRICAGMVSPCPPGIPLAVPGEILDRNLCFHLKKCGILTVNVLK